MKHDIHNKRHICKHPYTDKFETRRQAGIILRKKYMKVTQEETTDLNVPKTNKRLNQYLI